MKVWDHNACKAEIESLRQQLAAMTAERDEHKKRLDFTMSVIELRRLQYEEEVLEVVEQRDAHIKREVMLRIAVEYCVAQVPELGTVRGIEEALAATDDLDGLILCDKEPCRDDGRCQYAIDHGAEGLGHCQEGKCCMPLYRAWEPK